MESKGLPPLAYTVSVLSKLCYRAMQKLLYIRYISGCIQNVPHNDLHLPQFTVDCKNC